jgi:hypothetical protein
LKPVNSPYIEQERTKYQDLHLQSPERGLEELRVKASELEKMAAETQALID